MNPAVYERFRREKDQFFRTSPHSPLLPTQKKVFAGLNYFPPNEALALEIQAEEFPQKDSIQMQTSTGDLRTYQRWGKLIFGINNEPVELTLYYSPEHGHFFLPFMDVTSGSETYGAGRYLDPEPLGDGVFRVDFNLAYSPYCAYNENYSCPIPPAENRLKVRIEAGEKNIT